MTGRDPRVDGYLAKSADFAHPIPQHLRALIHAACPEAGEVAKWGMRYFNDRGASMCMMSAFRQHGSFGFWLGKQAVGASAKNGVGELAKINSLMDLPPKRELVVYIKKAMALNETGVTLTRTKAAKPAPAVPDDLAALLNQKIHIVARETCESLGAGAQREYIDWITDAKTSATRQKRLVTTMEWLADGRKRSGKYEKAPKATKP